MAETPRPQRPQGLSRSATVARPDVPAQTQAPPAAARPPPVALYPIDIGEPAPIVDPSDDSSATLVRPGSLALSPSKLERSITNASQHNPLFDSPVASPRLPPPRAPAGEDGDLAKPVLKARGAAARRPSNTPQLPSQLQPQQHVIPASPHPSLGPLLRRTNSLAPQMRRTLSTHRAPPPQKAGMFISTNFAIILALGLALGFCLQNSVSMGVELRTLRYQIGWCDAFARTGFKAGTPRSSAEASSAPSAIPWSLPPTPPSRPLAAPASPEEHARHHHEHYSSIDRSLQPDVPLVPPTTVGSVFLRFMAALLAVGCVVGTVLAWRRLDTLPQWLQAGVRGYMALDDRSAASVPGTTPLSKHVAYKLDYWFSRNPWAKALSLIYVTLALIYIGGLGMYAVSGQPLHEAFWEAIAGAGFDWKFSEVAVLGLGLSGFFMRSMSVVVSIGGMLITALLLGIVSDSIADSMEGMRKGKADVLESGHTLILGWSDKLLAIVDQICNANVSEGGRPIVILAERDKESMEDDINAHSPNLRGSRVIVRSGNPLLSLDLGRVSAERARTIVVLASGGGPAQSDARVLRTTLSLMGLHDLRTREGQGGLQGHIVAELSDMDNDALVRMVGGDMVETVVSHDIIGRLMIQCARQPGLASVWEQLLGFDGGCSQDNLAGDEFYIREWPELTGKSFQEVLLSFPSALPVGVKIQATGEVKLNPDDSYTMADGDKLIVLAEDDNTYAPAEQLPEISDELDGNPEWKARIKKERVLFVGWRRDMHDMIAVLDQFVTKGSELYLYNEVPPAERTLLLLKGGLDPNKDLKNVKLVYQDPDLEGDPVDRRRLEQLHPERFSSILILADDSASVAATVGKNLEPASIADADSRCLASLLLLRDIQSTRMPMGHSRLSSVAGEAMQQQSGMVRKSWFGADLQAAAAAAAAENTSLQASNNWYNTLMGAVRQTVVISEILDSRTRNLIAELHVGEFVLSNELVSMTLAMVSESREVNTILTELFTPNGNELYVLPAARFLGPSETLNFYEVLLRARARQEIVIGYKNFGMDKPVVNPKDKDARVLSVDLTDTLVVLSLGLEPEKVKSKEKSNAAKASMDQGYGDYGLAAFRASSFSRR